MPCGSNRLLPLLALVVLGCGHDWDQFAFGGDGGSGDAVMPDGSRDASEDAPPPCGGFVFGFAEELEELNSEERDWGPSITEDGVEVFWARSKTLYSASRVSDDQPFSNIKPLELLSGDSYPQILGGSTVLYFESATEIFRTERSVPGGTFANVRRVEVSGLSGQVNGLFVTDDELTIYLSASGRLQVATRSNAQLPFEDLRDVGSINDDGKSRSGVALRGDRLLYTVSDGASRIGYAERSGPNSEDFEEVALLALGDTGGDADPFLMPDGKTLLFASIRGPNDYDLYTAPRICE